MQQGRPIAYFSQALCPKNQSLSTYEKELLAIMTAVTKWAGYLVGAKFVVRTDHASLKYLREQKITNALQQKWLYKLMGYDFTIEYKQGRANLVADALSRKQEYQSETEATNTLLTTTAVQIKPSWVEEIILSYAKDKEVQDIIAAILVQSDQYPHYSLRDGILRYQDRIVVGNTGDVRVRILHTIHATAIGGHSGIHTSYQRLKSIFYWKGQKKDVEEYISGCDICKQCKGETVAYPGLLQPLPIPTTPWSQISMDFIEGLPNSEGRQVIWVIVDRLTKYAHFIGLSHPYTAEKLAEIYLQHIYKLHGDRKSVV